MSTEQVVTATPPPAPPTFFGGHKTAEDATKGFESMLSTIGWKPEHVFGDKGLFKDASDPRAAGAWELGQKLLSANIRKADPLPDTDPSEYLKAQGFNADEALKHLLEKGSIPDAEKAKLKGVPTKWVETFLRMDKQRVDALTEMGKVRVTAALGGEENANKTLAWVRTSMTPEEIKKLDTEANSAFGRGDYKSFDQLYAGLKSKFEASIGADKKQPLSGTPAVGSATPFANANEQRNEMLKLMQKGIKPMQDSGYVARLKATKVKL